MCLDVDFYKGKRIFVTGHTGFKGSWLCRILINAGADVTGYALEPEKNARLFGVSGIVDKMHSIVGDIRDSDGLLRVFEGAQPEIVFHLAAQPIVLESYKDPAYTYETNVMGTVNILECIRKSNSVRSFVNVTTDKVYKNKMWCWGYRETDELDGSDPYSNSKSCSELVTDSYFHSFFKQRKIAVSTARAGNVIGGGDFSANRIIPDCVRCATKKEAITVRNPSSIRPYQFVLESLSAYLMIAEKQCKDFGCAGNYNIGPAESDTITTGQLVDIFCRKWKNSTWRTVNNIDQPHEEKILSLDCSKIRSVLGWRPVYDIEKAVEKTVDWYKCFYKQGNISELMDQQIKEYLSLAGVNK